MEMRIFKKNIESAEKKKEKELLYAVPEEGILFIRVEKYIVKYDAQSNTVTHACSAVSKNIPCYHLGAVIHYCTQTGVALPPQTTQNGISYYTVHVIPRNISEDEAIRIIENLKDENRRNIVIEAERKKAEEEKQKEIIKPEIKDDEILIALFEKVPLKLLEKIKNFRNIQKNRLTDEQLSRVPAFKYKESNGELVKALMALLQPVWTPPLLVGPKGTGKSTLAESLAAVLHLPVVKLFGGIDVNAEGLLGGKTLIPYENKLDAITEAKLRAVAKQANIDINSILQRLRDTQLRVGFEFGPLLSAIINGEMVIFEEINMVPPDVLSLLHGLLDWSRKVFVPGYGIVTAPEHFRLVGCINPDYAGTKELNEAFEDRFRIVEVPYASKEVLIEILVRESNTELLLAQTMVDIFTRIRNRAENGDISTRALSFRRLLRAAEDINMGYDIKEAITSNLTEGLDEIEKSVLKEIIADFF